MHGPTCIFWANLTPFSHSSLRRAVDALDAMIALPGGVLVEGLCRVLRLEATVALAADRTVSI
jgi:hypothetical protein